MPKFVYRMQNILEIKYKLEEQAKQEYGQIQARLNEAEADLLKLKNMLSEDYENLKEAQSSVLDILEIDILRDGIVYRKGKIEEQRQVVKKLEREVERARMKLNEAMQERKMHEKLKEKQFDAFVKEMNDKESKEVDELVSYTYNDKESD
ncbi:MAG: flagellar export protein FliJ [Lachnospiraceae bacterium]|nr:flagellar export protein FliJ [Lachnospiraceae bacterium]